MPCPTATYAVQCSSSSTTSLLGDSERISLVKRGRRHSYDDARRHQPTICNADAVYMQVDLFLNEMRRRFDRLEKYRQESLLHMDAQLERAYNVLRDVRDTCATYSSGELLWGAAKHRAGLVVETLEYKYMDILPTLGTTEQKAQVSMNIMENYLTELEAWGHARSKNLMDSGRKKMDDSLTATREMFEEGYDKAKRATDMLADSVAHALSRAAETTLIRYEELPVPWRVNPHILKGYRFNKTKVGCITSAFRPSNETVNIWSHAIGLVIVLAIAFIYYPSSPTFSSSSKWDILIAGCFFAAACKCLICSTMWHTMNCIADRCLLDRFACVDYTGISFLIAASILSTEWTAFYCEPISRTIYMTTTAVLGCLGVILPWQEKFNRADMAWARVLFYVSLGATGFAPMFQLNLTRGAEWTFYFYAPITKSIMVYLTGAVIYASQVPEKWWPGLFDYAGASHNIWHFAVLGGILFHYTAMMEFFQGAFQRSLESGGCCVV